MAINLGLSAREMRQLNDLLISHHRIAVTVQLLDLSHNYAGDVSNRLLSGQVDIDADADEATRTCSLELLDPFNQLHLDSDAPDDGSIYYTRMFKIIYHVISIDETLQFNIPIFCGPLTKVDRNGVVLTVAAAGKEKLARNAVWKGKSYKKGAKKTQVIQSIMTDLAGEQRTNFIDRKAKGPKVTFDSQDTAWDKAKQLAGGMRIRLFYDGRGVLQMRAISNKKRYTFKQSEAVLTDPSASFDAESVINCVQVIGGKPKKATHKIKYRIAAPKKHPLSPWSMGRWGKPRFIPEIVEDDSIKSKKTARKVAKEHLQRALIEQVEVNFDSLPIPYLEEGDVCRVQTDQYTGNFMLRKMSIPLTADGVMSVGYLKRVSPSRTYLKIKNHHRKKHKHHHNHNHQGGGHQG